MRREAVMGLIIITLIVFCAALVLLIFLSNYYMRFWLNRIVISKTEWLDFVQVTGQVPIDWRTKHEKAIAKAASDNNRVTQLKAKARTDYLGRLEKLVEYAKVSTLIPNDAERNQILKDLAEIRQDWEVNDDVVFTPAR